jgi:hypothetical protein
MKPRHTQNTRKKNGIALARRAGYFCSSVPPQAGLIRCDKAGKNACATGSGLARAKPQRPGHFAA